MSFLIRSACGPDVFKTHGLNVTIKMRTMTLYSLRYAVNITFHGLATKYASLAISASKHGGQLVNGCFTYLKDITLNPGYLKGWGIF